MSIKEIAPKQQHERMAKSPRDHTRAIVIASINAIPVVGAVIASLVESYVPKSEEEAIKKAMDAFCQKLEDLEGRLDADAVQKEEFVELYGSFKRVASGTNGR